MFLWKIFSLFLCHIPVAWSFEIQVEVPAQAQFLGSVTLSCYYNLGGRNLYSLKWYKDEYEFFRYMPNYAPQMQIFPVDGVILDASQSSLNQVTLIDLTFNSSGSYRCEVSSEGPEFQTVVKNYEMKVVAFPDHDPILEGFQTIYSVGDIVAGNCTTAKSKPPAVVTWHINKGKAIGSYVKNYPPTTDDDGLMAVTLGLLFIAETHDFLGVDRMMELMCIASVEGHTRNATFRAYRPMLSNQKLSADMLGNTGTSQFLLSQSTLVVLLAAMWLCRCCSRTST